MAPFFTACHIKTPIIIDPCKMVPISVVFIRRCVSFSEIPPATIVLSLVLLIESCLIWEYSQTFRFPMNTAKALATLKRATKWEDWKANNDRMRRITIELLLKKASLNDTPESFHVHLPFCFMLNCYKIKVLKHFLFQTNSVVLLQSCNAKVKVCFL